MNAVDATERTCALAAELSAELRGAGMAEGVIRAEAMLAAAVGFLTEVAGHAYVATQLREDADLVMRHAPTADAVLH